jgi:hypothetical protein
VSCAVRVGQAPDWLARETYQGAAGADSEMAAGAIDGFPALRAPDHLKNARVAICERLEPAGAFGSANCATIEQLQESITRIVDGMLDRIEADGPAFDGMRDYGAHLVVDALLDAMDRHPLLTFNVRRD